MARDLRWAVGRPRGRGPLHAHCPAHDDHDASLAVWHDHAYCFGACQRYFAPAALLALLGKQEADLQELDAAALARLERRQVQTADPVLVPVWEANLWSPHSPVANRLAALEERGLLRATIRRARLGHTGAAYSIPVFGLGERLLTVKFRRDDATADPREPKYRALAGHTPTVYRPFGGAGRPTVICEGEFDALLLGQHGLDALTSTGGAGSLATLLRGWRFRQPVWVLTDQDAAGEDAYAALQASVQGSLRRVRWRGGTDVSDALASLGEADRTRQLERWLQEETA